MGNVLSGLLTVGSIAAAPFTAGTSLAWLPAAAGATGAAIAGIDASNDQKAAAAAQNAAETNQQNALAQNSSLAQQIAQGEPWQSLVNAQGSDIATLKANEGGIANPGALYSDLSGTNLNNALQSSIATRTGNLSAAAGILGGNASQYGNIAQQAGEAGQGNPWSPAISAFQALSPYLKKPGGTNTATGLGAQISPAYTAPATLTPTPAAGDAPSAL